MIQTTIYKNKLAQYTGNSKTLNAITFYEIVIIQGLAKGQLKHTTQPPDEMKTAINYLKSVGITCDNGGNILSRLPDGERGLILVDMLQENTMTDSYCYTINNN